MFMTSFTAIKKKYISFFAFHNEIVTREADYIKMVRVNGSAKIRDIKLSSNRDPCKQQNTAL